MNRWRVFWAGVLVLGLIVVVVGLLAPSARASENEHVRFQPDDVERMWLVGTSLRVCATPGVDDVVVGDAVTVRRPDETFDNQSTDSEGCFGLLLTLPGAWRANWTVDPSELGSPDFTVRVDWTAHDGTGPFVLMGLDPAEAWTFLFFLGFLVTSLWRKWWPVILPALAGSVLPFFRVPPFAPSLVFILLLLMLVLTLIWHAVRDPGAPVRGEV